nr:MAG TPA: hypothetical protein [Caudoviricetes sp.]
MKKDLAMPPFESSFLSCEKDTEIILRKLFIESRPYSDLLKRLLIINTPDCIDNKTSPIYQKKIDEVSLKDLVDKQYIILSPKIKFMEHEEIKSYIIITFDQFIANETNPQFRDCNITITILTHTDYQNLGNYRNRPLKIAGYIDGILDNTKLTGIGTLHFIKAFQIFPDENFSGYSLVYEAIHGSDDKIPGEEDD